jgi:hypothetical protein
MGLADYSWHAPADRVVHTQRRPCIAVKRCPPDRSLADLARMATPLPARPQSLAYLVDCPGRSRPSTMSADVPRPNGVQRNVTGYSAMWAAQGEAAICIVVTTAISHREPQSLTHPPYIPS